MKPRRVLLLRHTAVAPSWRGRCYGRHDVPLGREGRQAARALASLASGGFDLLLASPLRRARWLGALLARHRGLPLQIEPRLAERSFGCWEARPWDSIWAEEGSAMDGILDAPDSFRPGGGETTAELGRRALSWFESLPSGASVLAATHGGPIGALVGLLRAEPPRAWLAHIPREGGGVLIEAFPGRDPVITPWTRPWVAPAAGHAPGTPPLASPAPPP